MSKNGLVTDGEGWVVVNAREARWIRFDAHPLYGSMDLTDWASPAPGVSPSSITPSPASFSPAQVRSAASSVRCTARPGALLPGPTCLTCLCSCLCQSTSSRPSRT